MVLYRQFPDHSNRQTEIRTVSTKHWTASTRSCPRRACGPSRWRTRCTPAPRAIAGIRQRLLRNADPPSPARSNPRTPARCCIHSIVFTPFVKWPKGSPLTDDSAWDIVPDLCVEVVSPSVTINGIEDKVDEYFAVGVPLVWVVLPNHRRVKVYRSPLDIAILTDRDTLAAEEILPGFQLPLAGYFDL